MVSNPEIIECSLKETRKNVISFEEAFIAELQVANALVEGKGGVLVLSKNGQLEVLGAQEGMPSSKADWEGFVNGQENDSSEHWLEIVEVKNEEFPFPFMLKLRVHCKKSTPVGYIFIGREQQEMPAKEKQIALRTLSNRLGKWLTAGKIDQWVKAQREREWFYEIIELSPDAVAIADANREPVYMNEAAMQLTGVTRDRMLEMDFSDFYPEWVLTKLQEEGFPVAHEKGVWTGETALLGADGSEIPVKQTLQVQKDEEGNIQHISIICRDLRDIKASQQQLTESEERYRALFENSPNAKCVLKQKEIVQVNSRMVELTGAISKEEIQDTFLFDHIPPEYHERLKEMFKSIKATGNKSPAFEVVIFGEGNAEIKVSLEASILSFEKDNSLIQVSINDITEQKRANEEIRKFSQIAEVVHNGIMITDAEGVVEWANAAFESHTGFELASIRGEAMEDLLKGGYTDRGTLKAFIKEVRSKGEGMDELVLYGKEGHPKWFNISVTEVGEIGTEKQYIFIFTDIAENKRIEGQLMNAVIETQENERKRFSEDLHDGLGQSLSAAQMNLYILQDVIPPEKKEVFQNVVELIQRAIQETRVVSHDLMPSELKDFGLKETLENLIDKFNVPDQLHIEMNIEFGDERFDQRLEVGVYRMVQEIVSNAQKHSEATELTLRLYKIGGYLEIRAKDNGIGFEPETASSKGMGLNNLRKRTRALQGDIQFLSGPSRGAHIKIILPISN